MKCEDRYCYVRHRHLCRCSICMMRIDYHGACSCVHIKEAIEKDPDPETDYTLSDICIGHRVGGGACCPNFKEDWIKKIVRLR